jgi:hypothetical protein
MLGPDMCVVSLLLPLCYMEPNDKIVPTASMSKEAFWTSSLGDWYRRSLNFAWDPGSKTHARKAR